MLCLAAAEGHRVARLVGPEAHASQGMKIGYVTDYFGKKKDLGRHASHRECCARHRRRAVVQEGRHDRAYPGH
jgi:hypothetical protein